MADQLTIRPQLVALSLSTMIFFWGTLAGSLALRRFSLSRNAAALTVSETPFEHRSWQPRTAIHLLPRLASFSWCLV